MPPLTTLELGNDFNLDQSLRFGHLPAVFQEADPKAYLKSYVHTYLDEEVRQEGLTRNMTAFARFMEAASFSQGAVLNISEVARECSVDRKVVEGYFSILEDLLIAKAFYLYGGNRYYQEGNIEIIPIQDALVKLFELL